MRHVLARIEEGRLRIENHPLHHWLAEPSDDVDDAAKLWFALYFTNFIMYFRELNLYHISYGEDRSRDPLREALSVHADEDMTHSRLFMKDLRSLGWDDLLDWRPSEVFHWLFTSDVNESLRRRTTEITKLVIESKEPAERYPVVEAIEACGNALFRNTTMLAERYTSATGTDLVYWGAFHLERETGHAVEEDGLFDHIEFTPEVRDQVTQRAMRAFELIDEQNSDMLRLAQETISQGGFDPRRRTFAAPDLSVPYLDAEEIYDFNFWPTAPSADQEPIRDRLNAHIADIRNSDLLDFFTYTTEEEALEKLRLAALFIATDTTGTPTVYKYMVPYRFPVGARQRAVNRLAARFGRRARLLYVDWASLQLDERLDWPVSRTLDFIYLDQATESHRDLRAVITHHIDVNRDPVLRYWTIVALKSLSATYADAIGDLARRIEADTGLSLPYLSLKLNPDPVILEPDPEADRIKFESLPLDRATADAAMALIDDVHHGVSVRLQGMIDACRDQHLPVLV